MTRIALILLLAAAGCRPNGNPPPSDSDRLEGAWRVVRLERGGAATTDGELLGAIFEFTDGRVALHTTGQLWAMEEGFTLEPHHNPPRIIIQDEGRERDRRKELPSDWINEEETLRVEQGRDRKIAGIYRFDAGNRLTLCFIKGGESPPWRFDSKIHRDCILIVLEKLSE